MATPLSVPQGATAPVRQQVAGPVASAPPGQQVNKPASDSTIHRPAPTWTEVLTHPIKTLLRPADKNSNADNLILALYGTLLGGLLIWLVSKLWSRVQERLAAWGQHRRRRRNSSAEWHTFTDQTLQEATGGFIANQLERWNEQRQQWELLADNGLTYLLHEVLPNEQVRTCLLTGPTGIGKTTLLQNLYVHYRRDTVGRDAPPLLLGRVVEFEKLRRELDQRIAAKTSQNTIVLLDALDEYRYQRRKESFDDEFMAFWRQFQDHYLPHFRQVVVAARTQFFEALAEQSLYAGHLSMQLRLLPFDKQQREAYLNQRYANQPPLLRRLHALHVSLTEKKHTFIELPLLLTYLEAIEQKQEEQLRERTYREKEFLTGHNIMKVLVDNWLAREKNKELNSRQLEFFCKRLAFALVNRPPNVGLSAEELRGLEAGQLAGKRVLEIFDGRGDRSLLIRESQPDPTGEYGGERFFFKFVHERFLGYFLALYAEDDPAHELAIPFAGHPYAVRYFMGKRWRERRSALPAPYPDLPGGRNIIPATELTKWSAFFNGLTSNEQARVAFRATWETILLAEAPDWESLPAIKRLRNLVITRDNFESAEARAGISYLRNFVVDVDLQGDAYANDISWLAKKGDWLSCFAGITSLQHLKLDHTGLQGNDLAVFCASASKLQTVWLAGINLGEGQLADWLSQLEQVTYLDLDDTHLPAKWLPRLPDLSSRLVGLQLNSIDLSEYDLSWLAQSRRLHSLDLNETHLPSEQLPSFAPLATQFTNLQLSGLNLSGLEASWLSQANQLTSLDLDETRLPSSHLPPLASLATQLTNLRLNGINLSQQDMSWLPNARNLEALYLNDTQLPGKWVAHLAGLAPRLVDLRLGGIDLRGQDLSWLTTASRLVALNLNDTYLPSEWILRLAPLAPKLMLLGLQGLDLRRGVDWFADMQSVWSLSLSRTALPPEALGVFESSRKTIRRVSLAELDLRKAYTRHYNWLEDTADLRILDLSATGLPASYLAWFATSATTLRRLGLGGLQLGSASTWLPRTSGLTHLNLRSTNLSPAELTWFVQSAHSLRYLDVANNPRLTPAAFNCFPEKHRARLLALAEESRLNPLAI